MSNRPVIRAGDVVTVLIPDPGCWDLEAQGVVTEVLEPDENYASRVGLVGQEELRELGRWHGAAGVLLPGEPVVRPVPPRARGTPRRAAA